MHGRVAPPSSFAASSSISTLHPDIIEAHILTRLDASALASASCVSSQLYSLIASDSTLWTNVCHSTWPSTQHPRLRDVISSFPNGGPRSFFADSFTNPTTATTSSRSQITIPDCCIPPSSSELISAVDIYYRNQPIFSRAVVTESFEFNSSRFRVDLLDPKHSVPTRLPHPINEGACRDLWESFTLSWIVIDPAQRRAMNLSSCKPVRVEHRSLSSGEVHVRYDWVFQAGDAGSTTERVKCGISVTCEGGEMHVRKASLQLEDVYGKQMSGKESLAVLMRGMEGKRGNLKDGRRRYEEYIELRRERILTEVTTKQKRQARLDFLYMASGLFLFASLLLLAFRKCFFFLFLFL